MKIILLALALLAFGANAQMKAPTVYGKLNKMIRYIDQDPSNYRALTGVEDVGGLPSRLGLKGKLNTANTKVSYALEMGYDSESSTGGAGEGISVRRAVAYFDWGFGNFIIGQEWTAASLVGASLDPLLYTGANLLIPYLGASTDVAGGANFIGYTSRTRKEQIGYTSPEFAGFQLKVSYDSDDKMQRDAVTFNNGLETALSYKIDLGSIKLEAYGGYVSVHGASANKNDTIMGGGRVIMGDLKISGIYTTNTTKSNADVEVDTTNVMLAASYKMGDSTIATTYGKKDNDTNKQSVISLGYLYDVNKHVQLNTFASIFSANGSIPNHATILGIGTTLQF